MKKKIIRQVKASIFEIRRKYRQIRSSNRLLPSFLIGGSQKSGTTSLFSYMIKHPEITSPIKKEVHYFDLNYNKSVEWYKSFFPMRKKVLSNILTGEASPQYIFYPFSLNNINELLPNVKIILLLRNPVLRAYSHYNHQVRMKREEETFEVAIRKEQNRIKKSYNDILNNVHQKESNYVKFTYLERGKYFEQVEKCFKLFGKKNVLILQSEKFKENPQFEINKVFKFLGLEPCDIDFNKKYNSYKYPPMNKDTKKKLEDFFKPYNEKLYDLIGERFDW